MSVAAEIARGGGVYARALIVGPRQENWLAALERIDAREVEKAIGDVLGKAKGLYPVAARYLNVTERFLGKYRPTLGVRPENLAPYRPPMTKEEALPIVRTRCGGVGQGDRSGAWRVEDLLDNPVSRRAAVEAIRIVAASCSSVADVASTFGVTKMTLRKWRLRYPEVDAIVSAKRGTGGRQKRIVGLGSGSRKRLSLEEGIDLMRPHLPGTATEVHEKVVAAAESGRAPHGVVPTRGQLSSFVGKPDSRGLMVARWRRRAGDRIERAWVLLDVESGERIDKGKNDGRSKNGRPKGAKDKRKRRVVR